MRSRASDNFWNKLKINKIRAEFSLLVCIVSGYHSSLKSSMDLLQIMNYTVLG